MATASASKGSTGFFSSFSSTVSNIGNSLSSLLPVWTQYSQAKQQKDQLANPTVNQAALPANLNGIGGWIKANPVSSVALIGGAILVVVLLMKVLK